MELSIEVAGRTAQELRGRLSAHPDVLSGPKNARDIEALRDLASFIGAQMGLLHGEVDLAEGMLTAVREAKGDPDAAVSAAKLTVEECEQLEALWERAQTEGVQNVVEGMRRNLAEELRSAS